MLRFRRAHGTPMTFSGITVTPEAQVVMWHGARSGFVWNCPSAVLVEQAGRKQRIPILNVNHLLQLLFLGMLVAVPLTQLLARRLEKEFNR
jgi:hypothetical protein